MADAYLNIAETVLGMERRPLRPREIVQLASSAELLPWHLHGPRQDKTMHARLSEDVARNPENSRFYRTAPGVFYLQKMRSDPTTPEAYREQYLAPPRRKELRRQLFFAMKVSDVAPLAKPRSVDIPHLLALLEAGAYSYRPFLQIKESADTVLIHSFVVIVKGDSVLSFRCGKFFPESDPLYGRRSIGLGGAVASDNNDFLYNSMHGIIESGIGELGYGIGLPRRLAERARYEEQVTPQVAVYLDPDFLSPPVLQVVLRYRCPVEFEPSKAALSVNDLRWISAHHPGNDLQDYDETSRYLFAHNWLKSLIDS